MFWQPRSARETFFRCAKLALGSANQLIRWAWLDVEKECAVLWACDLTLRLSQLRDAKVCITLPQYSLADDGFIVVLLRWNVFCV